MYNNYSIESLYFLVNNNIISFLSLRDPLLMIVPPFHSGPIIAAPDSL